MSLEGGCWAPIMCSEWGQGLAELAMREQDDVTTPPFHSLFPLLLGLGKGNGTEGAGEG